MPRDRVADVLAGLALVAALGLVLVILGLAS